jgi:spermidine synthase
VRRDVVSLHAALILSGAAGLIYQSSWTRLLQRVFGVGDLAVATVLATFFLGLGLGNGIAARYVSRITRPGRAYAILEVAIGLYALLSLAIVPGLGAAYGLLDSSTSFFTLTLVRFGLACLALLPPTILMGATLPVVAEASKDAAWSRSVTAFYTSNTLGAVIGAALAGFVLVPQLGTRATVVTGAALSFAAAAFVLLVLRDARKPEADAAPSASTAAAAVDSGAPGTTPIGLAAALSFLAGMAALGSEVVWTRVLRIIVHGTTPAFAAMLVNYLLGIAAGALVARSLSRRFHPAAVLGVSQTLLVAFTALAMALVPFLPRIIPVLAHQQDTVPHETWILGLVSGVLLFPLALVLGTGLPTTWAMIEKRSDAGRGAAVLLAANTAGGLVGSLVTGFGLVPGIGTEATLLALGSVNAIVAAIALRHAAPREESGRSLALRVLALVGPLAVLTLVLVARPSIQLRFLLAAAHDPVTAMIQGPGPSWDQRTVFLREGRNTTVSVVANPGVLSLYNDGRPESGFSAGQPGFGPELVVLGGLPGILSGEQRDAMIIGLGAGHTASMALAAGFEHVRVIELEDGVVEASRLLYEGRQRPVPLDDPRAELVVDDARNQLQMMPADSLDAVISQPSHPWLAGSSALYTIEFFREVDRALRDDGVFGLWVNLFRMDMPHMRAILRTLIEVFPHVRGFVVEGSSLVLMASSTPRPFTSEHTSRIEAADEHGPYFAPHGLGDARSVLAHQEMGSEAVAGLAEGGALIVDDRPLLELELARIPNGMGLHWPDFDWALREQPWSSDEVDVQTVMARIEAVETRARALDRLDGLAVAQEALVRGRLAEARGNLTAALAAYDEDDGLEAGQRAAALRHAEGLDEQLAQMGRSWPADVEVDDAVLLAALNLYETIDPGTLELARRSTTPLAAYFVRAAEEGCGAAPRDEPLAEEHAEVARFEARCATTRRDVERMLRYEQLAWRARTVLAADGTRRGEEALAAGNGGLALMLFRRTLRNYPTTTRAAIGLARLHSRDGRPDEAREVLRAALEATEHLEEAQGRITDAAASLNIELEPTTVSPGASSASTAPETMATP